MARTGISAVWHDEGEKWELRELPVPETEPDAISVRVRATCICGSDLGIRSGDRMRLDGKPREPFVFGHEMMGEVAELGSKIKTDSLGRPLKEGDRVVYAFFFPCMRCYNCIRGELHACKNRIGRVPLSEWNVCNGGYAQYYYLRGTHFVFKAPDELSNAALAPVNCALAQVTHALDRGRVRLGDNVVIQGAGGLGIYATAIAREMGAGKVIVVEGQKPRLDLARQCGATDTIDLNEYPTADARVERVMQLTNGIGADTVIELVGSGAVLPEGIDMCRMHGTYLEVGMGLVKSDSPPDLRGLLPKQISFISFQHYNPWVIPAAVDFLIRTRDRYRLTDLVSHEFPLERIEEAFKTADWHDREEGTAVTRAIVTP